MIRLRRFFAGGLIKEIFNKYLIFLLTGLFIAARLLIYNHPQLSIGTNDTPSYLAAAQVDFSLEFFESIRPATIPLLYKLFEPEGGYVLSAISEPALRGVHVDPEFQEGFNRVVLSQMIIGIVSWIGLAWVFYRRLQNQPARILSSVLIFLFALSPHIAEWDIVLQSESLHISLFVLLVALSIELLFRTLENHKNSPAYFLLVVFWVLILILWQYTRDANLYSVVLILCITLMGSLWLYFKTKEIPAGLILACVVLALSAILHNMTLHKSERWEQPLMSNLRHNILPYSTRTQFFVDHGMPNPEVLKSNLGAGIRGYKYREDEKFMEWLTLHGMRTYQKFLIDTPLWATLSLYEEVDDLFTWNRQPYHSTQGKFSAYFLIFGNMLHSSSTLIVLSAALMLVCGLFYYRGTPSFNLLLIGGLVFILAGLLLFISFHGDYYSKGRHAISSTVLFRLDFWLIFLILLDTLPARIQSRIIS